MPLDMRIQVGPNGWPGIFIPGDSAVFNCFRQIADSIERGEPWVKEVMPGWFREQAAKLEACRSPRPVPELIELGPIDVEHFRRSLERLLSE